MPEVDNPNGLHFELGLSAYLDNRQQVHGVRPTHNSKVQDLLAGLKHLQVDRRIQYILPQSNTAVVSLDVETKNGRYWLTALEDGSLNIFDNYKARIAASRPDFSFPLGYVPSAVEISEHQEQLLLRKIRPVCSVVLRNDQDAVMRRRAICCCKWLPDEQEAVISSAFEGKVGVWDIKRFSSSMQPTALFEVNCRAKSPVHYFAINGESASLNVARVQYCHPRGSSHRLIACCSLNSHAALRLLDLRSGTFIADMSQQYISPAQARTNNILSGGIMCATWNPLNQNLLLSGGFRGHMLMWDIRMYSKGCAFEFRADNVEMPYSSANDSQDRLSQLRHAMSASATSIPIRPITEAPDYSFTKKYSTSDRTKVARLHGFQSDDALWEFVRGRQSKAQATLTGGDTKKQARMATTTKVASKGGLTIPGRVIKGSAPDSTSTIPSRSITGVPGHNFPITAITFIAGGAYVISSTLTTSMNNSSKCLAAREHLRLWNTTTGQLLPIVFDVPRAAGVAPTAEGSSHTPSQPNASSRIIPVRPEVVGLERFSPEGYCCGIMSGLAVFDTMTGKLVNFVNEGVVGTGRNVQAVLALSTPSILSNEPGQLITVDDQGYPRCWNSEFKQGTVDEGRNVNEI